MTSEEFVRYVDGLPEACIEERTEVQIVFHLPLAHPVCPACKSTHTEVDRYRKQAIKGLSERREYVYRKRRYRCTSCGKTFSEKNPFIGKRQTRASSLKRVRGNKGVTFVEMCKRLDIPEYLYKGVEKDEIPPPSMEAAERIVSILDSSIEEIWGDPVSLRKRIDVYNKKKEAEARQKRAERLERQAYRQELHDLHAALANLPIAARQKLITLWKSDTKEMLS